MTEHLLKAAAWAGGGILSFIQFMHLKSLLGKNKVKQPKGWGPEEQGTPTPAEPEHLSDADATTD